MYIPGRYAGISTLILIKNIYPVLATDPAERGGWSIHHTVLLVVVDKLSKMTHLIPTKVQGTGEGTSRKYVVKNHGIPNAIVSKRDPRFKGNFMTALLEILGTQQRFSTAYHPQTDDQTERMNRTLEDTLRHYVAPHHTDWDEHIAMANFATNNSHQESINTTPFRLNNFKDPPTS